MCFFSFLYSFFFIGNKFSADRFKDGITPSLKANDRLTFSQDVALNYVRDKGKPRCKLSYKLLKEEDGHDQLIEMSPYPTFIQLKYFLGGIHHCVTVVGECIFYSNFPFAIPLTK